MIVAIFPILLAVAGALVFALSSNASAKEIGRACLWAGLFAFAFAMAAHTVRIG